MIVTILYSVWALNGRTFSVNSDFLDNSEIRWVEEFCCSKERNASIKLKMKHDKKLSHLLGSKPSEHSDSNLKNRWVIYLSSKELTELERKGLEHGLNFAICPNRIPTAEIVASVEEAIFRQNDETKQTVRAEVSSILRRTKTPPRNIDSNVFKALIALRKDPDRVVLSADTNCVVVMDKHQYREKVLSMLNEKQTYTTQKSDPTGRTERNLNQRLLLLKKSSKISEETYKLLRSSDGLAPSPPVVSFVNSPTYNFSRYLARVLSPVVGNTDNTVKNSQHFAEFIRGQTLDADQMLVSFDVVSLFNKIPVNLAIKVATNRLRYDDSLWQRTSLPLEDITDLLSFCLNTTQFVFEGTYYKQAFGTAMGSPVSAVIANLVMEDIEHRALTTAPVSPSFWKRFVDDVHDLCGFSK